jgi:hypothetical protein
MKFFVDAASCFALTCTAIAMCSSATARKQTLNDLVTEMNDQQNALALPQTRSTFALVQ